MIIFGDERMDVHPDWKIVDDHHLEREWSFSDFASALDFVNIVGSICEKQNIILINVCLSYSINYFS